MPMRIVNLKGGGGPAPAPSGGDSDSGLYKFLKADYFNNTEPLSTKFVEIWRQGDKTRPRPDSITVMMWGAAAWHARGTVSDSHPPDCGSAFGIITIKGDDIPQKIYAWRGRHQPGYPYTYPKDRTFGFNSTPSREGAWLLPNMTGNQIFNNTDFVAPDAINNHWGDFDAVYNGGNGHFYSPSSTAHDSPGSNGSPFGNGKTSTTEYPASCGGSGTAQGRGPKARGIGLDILKPLGSLRPHAIELEPTDLYREGGTGGFEFELPTGSFGMARGVPYTPNATVVRVDGGQPPKDRTFVEPAAYHSPYLYILFEYAK